MILTVTPQSFYFPRRGAGAQRRKEMRVFTRIYGFSKLNIAILDNKLEDIVVSLMNKKGMTLSLAESCTGGMLASHIVNIPGSSNVLERSIITYSNKAKIDELSVSENSLYEFGAVSETIAREMVEGLFNKTHSDICVAITGIAGPNGASESKPVGLAYIAIKSCKGVCIKKYNFFGDRFNHRHKATLNALNLIRMELIEN